MRKFFDSIVKPVDRGSTDSLYALFRFAAIASVVVFGAAVIMALAGKDAGTFGDFIGGTLNPILTFLTFMGLIVTIVLQQQELADTRKELKRSASALESQSTALESQLTAIHNQNFESTFFQMLGLHNQLVNAMDIHRKNQETLHGRDCFRFFYDEMKKLYNTPGAESEEMRISAVNDRFWGKHHQDLAHYYRYFYNLIRFVDESASDKVKYIRILRSQLSNYELAVMFYNGLSPEAARSKTFIETYSMFDNLPEGLLFDKNHIEKYGASAFTDEGLSSRQVNTYEPTYLDALNAAMSTRSS